MKSFNQSIKNTPDSQYQELQRYENNQPILPQFFHVGEPVAGVEEELFSNTSTSDEYSAESCSSCSGSSSRCVESLKVLDCYNSFLIMMSTGLMFRNGKLTSMATENCIM